MTIHQQLGKTDIYLIDQILKGTYTEGDKLLDAGIGGGRNLHWFNQHDFELHGVDVNHDSIQLVKTLYPKHASQFRQADLANLPYDENSFDHVICNAVLHFAKNETHFLQMMAEMVRVLKTLGTLFVRMTSTFGMTIPFRHISEGVYQLHDGSTRFLLTPELLDQLVDLHGLQMLEPLKTTNVNDLRCMSTLVFRK